MAYAESFLTCDSGVIESIAGDHVRMERDSDGVHKVMTPKGEVTLYADEAITLAHWILGYNADDIRREYFRLMDDK